MTVRPRVFLVDDDAGIRRSLASALSKRNIDIRTFESAQAFLDSYEPGEPGCLLLDLSMPGMTGLELQQELSRARVSIPIIFITGHGSIQQSVQAIKAGAIDFLEKPFSVSTVLERIDEACAADFEQRARREYRATVQARFESLTAREREVMRLLVAGAATASSKQIATELGISHRTVDHHRARIMEKTRARSVTELAWMANWSGLLEAEPEHD